MAQVRGSPTQPWSDGEAQRMLEAATPAGSSDDSVFALLVPCTPATRHAFSTLADLLLKHPDANAYHLRHIHINDLSTRPTPVAPPAATDSDVSNESSSDADLPYTGHYKISFDPPETEAPPRTSWNVGGGRPEEKHSGVEILIGSGSRQEDGIRGIHMQLRWDLKTSQLVIVVPANAIVLLNGQEELRGTRHVLPGNEVGIGMGRLCYRLSLCMSATCLKDKLDALREASDMNEPPPPTYLSATSRDTLVVGKYTCRHIFSRGATSNVRGAVLTASNEGSVHKTFAVKIIAEEKATVHVAMNEQRIMQELGEHPNVIKLVEVFYGEPEVLSVRPMYIVYTPLGHCTLYDVINDRAGRQISNRNRASLFKQMLTGLSFIHARGIMHRDLKPGNVILRLHPSSGPSQELHQAIIIDFGCATFKTSSTNHMVGTVLFLAPEILKFKYPDPKQELRPPPYNNAVDVWALGLTVLYLFSPVSMHSKSAMNLKLHKQLLDELDKLRANDAFGCLVDIVVRMLSWEPDKRPLAKDVLGEKAVAQILTGFDEKEEGGGGDRPATSGKRKFGQLEE